MQNPPFYRRRRTVPFFVCTGSSSSWEAGSTSGGDSRCGAQKASSAFIIVAKPDNKKPYINLNILGQGKGGQNAVELLRRKFEKWKRRHEEQLASTKRS